MEGVVCLFYGQMVPIFEFPALVRLFFARARRFRRCYNESSVVQRRYTRQHLALNKFKRGATAG